MAQRGYCPFSGLGRDRASWLYVATWFPGCRQLLGRDRSFPGRDRGPPCVATVFYSLS